MSFIVSACGRSGTMFTWQTLNRLGIRTSFEEFFQSQVRPMDCWEAFQQWLDETHTCGEVSSLSAPHLGFMPESVTVIHLVRNPVAVIASLLGGKNFEKPLAWSRNVKFNFRHLPQLDRMDRPAVLAMKYWLYWNELIAPQAEAMFKAEDLYSLNTGQLKRLTELVGGEFSVSVAEAAMGHLGRTWNAGNRDMGIRWQLLPNCDLKTAIEEAAYRYGYTELDLYSYCPHCGQL